MNHFCYERTFRGKRISAVVWVTDAGVQVGLYGGDRPHIGAVGLVSPSAETAVTQFPGHQECILCEQWCSTLAQAGLRPLSMAAGVHYDHAIRQEIQQIVAQCQELLEEVRRQITADGVFPLSQQ